MSSNVPSPAPTHRQKKTPAGPDLAGEIPENEGEKPPAQDWTGPSAPPAPGAKPKLTELFPKTPDRDGADEG